MKIEEFLAILSTQLYLSFDHYITLKSLFETPQAFVKNYHMVMSEKECRKITDKKIFLHVEKIFEECQKNNSQILYPTHDDYPSCFLKLQKPPLFLNIKGALKRDLNFISIVGSRTPSIRVQEWMNQYIPGVVQQDYCIVSGAARGVDQMAHKIALRNQKPTIAFLPSGLKQIYPKDFQGWEDSILACGGALVSEYDPFMSIWPSHFAERNRMIAMLGCLVFICEAKLRSGSYMTARLAIENSKTLCVLPSFPTDLQNAGGLNLLYQGAFPIRDDKDLLILLSAEKLKKSV